jgi:hypothetical protein
VTTKQEDMLRKVRALIAKSEGTDNAHEADSFRAAADRLMAQYNIEAWQLAKTEGNEDASIGSRNYDFRFYTHQRSQSEATRAVNTEIPGYQWWLFTSIARHCRVKPVAWKVNFYDGEIPVVGTAQDIEYFDMLFTVCMLEMAKGLEPKPDKTKSFAENIAIMKESGMQWLRIAELLWRANMLNKIKYPDVPTQKEVHNMGLATVYTNFCAETNRPRLRVTPKVYQRSFMEGFTDEIDRRLRDMRTRRSQTPIGETDSGSGMEMVLADIYDRVQRKAVELYGNPPKSRGGRGRSREVKVDRGGMDAGAAAARRVDLGGTGRVGQGKGQLPKGN